MGNLCPSAGAKASEDPTIYKEFVDTTPTPIRKEKRKFLLLGGGDSGKSTFFRQLRLAFGQGYLVEERVGFTELIHSHVAKGFCSLVAAAEELGFLSEGRKLNFEPFRKSCEGGGDRSVKLLPEHASFLREMWESADIQSAWSKRLDNGFPRRNDCLLDHLDHYCESFDRIAGSGYVPTTMDIIKVRAKTTGVTYLDFDQGDFDFRVVDVGGQRAERRKWADAFNGVDVVLFFASLCEFDQVLFEDAQTNRMKESVQLFHQIVASRYLLSSSIVLILNKKDLLQRKVDKNVRMSDFFPHYQGPHSTEGYVEFVRSMFLQDIGDAASRVTVVCVSATDAADVHMVFSTAKRCLGLESSVQVRG